MATYSSTLAWKIPWMEESGGLQSMGSRRVGQDWATSLSIFTFMHWRRKWQPTPVFLPGESQGRGSVMGSRLWVAQSRTRLKRLSSSSSNVKGIHFFTSRSIYNQPYQIDYTTNVWLYYHVWMWELEYKESWNIKKPDCQRIDAFELWYWRRL